MDRRNFIQFSGVSLAGLLFSSWTNTGMQANDLLSLPVKLFVKLDTGVHELRPSGNLHWAYRDVVVRLKQEDGVLSAFVQSPTALLHQISFQWNYAEKKGATLCGDHWERTYGDVFFQRPDYNKKLPWYFVQNDGKLTTCFGVKTGCNSMCYWQVGEGKMSLVMDTRSGGTGVALGQRTLHLADVVATQGRGNENAFATAHRFCGMMCDQPLLPKKPVYGINDWYITYGKNSAEIILEHTAMMAEFAENSDNRPFSVIDSGWAAYSPLLPGDCCWQDDYSRPNKNFKDMQKVADGIKELGMRPGLWTRPLCAAHNDKETLLLPNLPTRNDLKRRVLDPTIPENLERVSRNIGLHREWGYELVKHDFTTRDILGRYGLDMQEDITSAGWRFYDNTKTTAEIILNMYKTIRAAAGAMYLIGCNTVSHLSAGLFEINRIGDDVSGREWDRTAKMGPNTLGFRMIQHEKFYAADGDCVGLTSLIPWAKNKQWMELLAESGTPLFISAQKEAMGSVQKQFVKQCFKQASQQQPIGEPLDWLKKIRPEKWKLNGQIKTFDWS